MHLAEKNNFPTLARDLLVERHPFSVTADFFPDPLTSQFAADPERGGCPDDVSQKHKKKSPPQPEEQPAAHRKHTSRQKENIAGREEKRVQHCAPPFHLTDLVLRPRNHLDHGKMPCGPDDSHADQEDA